MNNKNKEFNTLKKENNKLRDKIIDIFEDLKLEETATELWVLINLLIENELQQEELCNE